MTRLVVLKIGIKSSRGQTHEGATRLRNFNDALVTAQNILRSQRVKFGQCIIEIIRMAEIMRGNRTEIDSEIAHQAFNDHTACMIIR